MTDVYIGLGSNMGDRERHLRQAVALLAREQGITIRQVSSIYETEPVGFTDQPSFLNAVACLETDREIDEVLEICLAAEQKLHRVRDIRWGPRTIDIDILLCGDAAIDNPPKITVPHPRMSERLFVLIPLAEIAPEVKWAGKAVAQHISAVNDRPEVKLFASW
mgnify:CR=1 FL=1